MFFSYKHTLGLTIFFSLKQWSPSQQMKKATSFWHLVGSLTHLRFYKALISKPARSMPCAAGIRPKINVSLTNGEGIKLTNLIPWCKEQLDQPRASVWKESQTPFTGASQGRWAEDQLQAFQGARQMPSGTNLAAGSLCNPLKVSVARSRRLREMVMKILFNMLSTLTISRFKQVISKIIILLSHSFPSATEHLVISGLTLLVSRRKNMTDFSLLDLPESSTKSSLWARYIKT